MDEDLPNLSRDRGDRHSPANPERDRNATADRYALIHARRQIAREMAAANGVPFNEKTTIYDVSDDQDDIDILEELSDRIDQFNKLQTQLDREYIDARHAEQTALKRVSEAQRRAKSARSSIEELGDETDEYGDEYRGYAQSLLRGLERDFGGEGFDAGVPRSEGGGGYHESSDVTDGKLAQARRLLENGDPKDIPRAFELMEEAAEIYAEKFNADYYKAEADGDEMLDRGHRAVSIPSLDEGSSGWDYSDEEFDKEDGNSFHFIEDSLYGPSLKEAEAAATNRRERYKTWASTSGPVAPPRYGDPYGGKYPNELTDDERNALRKLRGTSDGDGFASRGSLPKPERLRTRPSRFYPNEGEELDEFGSAPASPPSPPDDDDDDFPDEGGFASRGRRRRPGRRNQGKRREGMAPKTRYSEEDRQNIADGNILRSRKRPGKRRGGPDASEWDGFASRTDTEMNVDMPLNPTKVFEGGEHGPGKEMSLKKMWENYRRGTERQTDTGDAMLWDFWGSTADDYATEEYMDDNGRVKRRRVLIQKKATLDDFMERFGPDSDVGLDAESVRRLYDSRLPNTPEYFIDDSALAGKLASELGRSPVKLFGFDPELYYDDDGNRIDFSGMPMTPDGEADMVDFAAEQERARRTARIAARANRAGRGDIIERRRDAAEPSRPVGEMSLREFEDKLFENTGVRVRLTDDEGDPLSPGAMMRNVRDSGLQFFDPRTGSLWSKERYTQMQTAGYLPDRYARELVNQKILKESDLARRDAISGGEFSQWPGFRELGGGRAKKIRDALIEMGLFEEGRSLRSIEEGLGRAGRGDRVRIKPDRLGGKGLLLSMAKVREMVERLGLDADEFEKWFRRTDNFTDGAPSAPTE